MIRMNPVTAKTSNCSRMLWNNLKLGQKWESLYIYIREGRLYFMTYIPNKMHWEFFVEAGDIEILFASKS
jgi:hypothetical protein